ncbi:MAG TPA: sugar phosphate isomerase/epimerase, partial [Gemmatimonadaceae bacterium]|nr:sugar phosphate isomerase/epimerase [Gemmatimonadaceae bacterium]
MNRRAFLATAGAAATGVVAACRSGAPGAGATSGAGRLDRIGVQLFSLPKLLEQDFDGTLAMLARLGYQEVELFGPYPFSVPAAHERWREVTPMLGFSGSGYFGRSARQVRESLDRHGLAAPSMHADLDTLRDRTEQVGEAAQTLGHRYAGIASIPPERRRTLDDYRRMADELNAIGARAKPMGFKVLYHNHGYGLSPLEGEIPLRILLDRLDPAVVSTEMDLFWTVAGGADPVALLDAYPRLYRLMHVKDMTKQARFAGDGGDPAQWVALFPFMTTAGSGVLDLPRILAHA